MEDGRIPWKTMVPPSWEGTVECAIDVEDMIGLEWGSRFALWG